MGDNEARRGTVLYSNDAEHMAKVAGGRPKIPQCLARYSEPHSSVDESSQAVYTFNVPRRLLIVERLQSNSGDTFDVYDERGEPVLLVKGKFSSLLRNQKTVYPAHALVSSKDGQDRPPPLGYIEAVPFHPLRKQLMYDAAHVPRACVQKDRLAQLFDADTGVFRTRSDGRTLHGQDAPQWLHITSDFLAWNFEVRERKKGPVEMFVGREIGTPQAGLGVNTYFAYVAPNIDLVFATMVVVCMDEIWNDKYN
ncbi:hypothetical protein FVE85_6942 [Porphyridium purpureum]|uniref:Uncharacterized protein n=1 Tax=Porphyridium purpureum TaxID=35688 RepID=A0A5J4Z9P0_PORPP|nr:hypothetical protein FVE85_6942 [Porphyridium purpureum]|eukprot:POR3600..scf295_1